MLSYRHAFHAGNHADVLKHISLVLTLDYYCQKDKNFWYIDTHSGSGLYSLKPDSKAQHQEYTTGIQRIWDDPRPPEAAQPYLERLKALNPTQLKHYAGSPWFAAQLLRRQDQLRLFELHPTDFTQLKQNFKTDKRVTVNKQDGLKGLISILPPITRRAVTLIDPSYEVKADYDAVVKTMSEAYKRFATGCYLVWYPVVDRQRIRRMAHQFQNSGIPNILQAELCVQSDLPSLGMTGSGLFIVNPPWTLKAQLEEILPWLTNRLGVHQASFSVQYITPEN